MAAVYFTRGHGFYLTWTVRGDGWDIPALNTGSIKVLWTPPVGAVRSRLSSTADVVAAKDTANTVVTIRLLVKPNDHLEPGTYYIQAWDLTGGAEIPTEPRSYTVAPSL